MLANVVVELFLKGGPVMWPILITALVAICVVGERTFWWWRQGLRREPEKLERMLAALENGDFEQVAGLSKDSTDPIIRMIWHGMHHVRSSLQGALQVAAGVELEKAGRFLTVLDTLVTLAPLLGLLGTVTGLMGAFHTIGATELAVEKITGGIAEALIATACGLAIAIVCLIPFNLFTRKSARLQFELETAATNIEVMVEAAKLKGYDTALFRKPDAEASA